MEKKLCELMRDESSLNVRKSKLENVAGSIADFISDSFNEQNRKDIAYMTTLTALAYAALC